jgi:DNA-binding NarL/FixJ family response regulator
MSIKVFIIDDHKILIDSFKDHFKHVQGIDVIGYALSGCEAIELLHPEERIETPDVILQDIGLTDMNGIECATALLKNDSTLKIIGVSSYMEISIVKKLLKVGAKGYVSKATDIEQLEEAIKKVHAGETFLGQQISQAMIMSVQKDTRKNPHKVIPDLTEREKEVLEQIAEEKSTKEIAEALFISPNTVETHRKHLILKFDVKNSVGLIKKAIEFNLLRD